MQGGKKREIRIALHFETEQTKRKVELNHHSLSKEIPRTACLVDSAKLRKVILNGEQWNHGKSVQQIFAVNLQSLCILQTQCKGIRGGQEPKKVSQCER